MQRASKRKYHYIYKTTCIITNKFYIGMHSTENLNDGYIGSGKILWYSIKKYGKENHKCEILEYLENRDLLKAREKEIVNQELINEELCMNIQIGGGGGIPQSEQGLKNFREGASRKLKELRQDEVYRAKMLPVQKANIKKYMDSGIHKHNTFTGKNHTEETKRKIGTANSAKQKGKGNSQYNTKRITNGIENKKILITDIVPEGWKYGRKIKNIS